MNDDSLNDTQQDKIVGMSEHDNLIIELREWRLKLEKQIWNAAIEAAIVVATADYHVTAEEIRKLKK